ncbi:hypothetical protein Tco_0760933, partial [Tanacetum coccineum]
MNTLTGLCTQTNFPSFRTHKTPINNNNNRSRVRVRVCSRIKDLEPEVTGGSRKSASVSVKPSKEDEEKKQNYYVNTGDAIRTLREEFPDLFYKELTFDIY